ncbi:pogo transposable element with KRAB domain-like protein, partial [Aphelenchoides avenae]
MVLKEAELKESKKIYGGCAKRLKGGGGLGKDKEFDDKLSSWIEARKMLEEHLQSDRGPPRATIGRVSCRATVSRCDVCDDAADETAIDMDGNGGLNIEEKGAKEASTALAAENEASDPPTTSLKPFVVLKLKRPIDKLEDTFRNSLNLCWEGTTWMNNQIVERYLRATFKAPGFVQGKHLLVWDCFNAPISADTKKVF